MRFAIFIFCGLTIVILSVVGLQTLRFGNSSNPACANNRGDDQKSFQLDFLRAEFSEPLPQSIQVINFRCEGFQDLQVVSDFEVTAADGAALYAALERTFLEPQNGIYLEDSDKERHETVFPDRKRVFYTLPSVGILYIRKVEITLPNDILNSVSVRFEGYQY